MTKTPPEKKVEAPIIPPGTLPPPGIYVNGTRIVDDGGGMTHSEAILLAMPSPGGTLGWADTTVNFYVVGG